MVLISSVLNSNFFICVFREEEERRFEQTKQGDNHRASAVHPRDASGPDAVPRRMDLGRDRDSRHSNDDRGGSGDKYERSRSGGGGDSRYDYDRRNNAPPQSNIAPRFQRLMQKQQPPSGGRMDEDQQRPPPPKEIRLASHRYDRPSVDRGGYDSRGRDWQHERDRDRWSRSEPLPEKRPDGPRNHRNDSNTVMRDQRGDVRNDREREVTSNIQLAKRKDVTRGGELSDNDQDQRPGSRNKDEATKEVKSFLPPPATEIVSWADEPAEYDDVSPLSAIANNSSTSDRAFSEERRATSGAGPRNHGPPQHHHAPAPIPRDKLEADVRTDTKQSNFVPLRRTQGQQQQQATPVHQGSPASEDSEKKEQSQQHQRSTPPSNSEAVQNVWASRSKSRELPSDHVESSKSEDRISEESDRNKSGGGVNKDSRGRQAPQPVKSSHSGNAAATASTGQAGAGGNRRSGTRRQSSNPRNSDSYDEYYEDDGYRPALDRDHHVEIRKSLSETSTTTASVRKSKSPEDDETGQRKDHQQSNRSGAGNRAAQGAPTTASAGNRGSFRERRGGRAGYEDEESRKSEGQQQQRPPRFQQQQQDVGTSSTTSNRDHKHKEDAWESDHAEASNRSGRRGGGSGRGGSNSAVNASNDRRRGKADSHGDYHYRQEGEAGVKEASLDESNERKQASKDRPQQQQPEEKRRNDQKDVRDRGGERGGDRNRGGGSGGARNEDRGFRGAGAGSNNKPSDQRFDQRTVKANLPPRLAAKLMVETQQGRSGNKPHGKNESGSADGHGHDVGPLREPGSSSKESTPPVQSQQQPSWEKSSGGGAPSSAGLVSGMSSMSLSDKLDAGDSGIATAATVILDGTTPPAQTIIFENTNLKSSDKGRGTPPVVVIPSINSQGPKTTQKSTEAPTKVTAPASSQQQQPSSTASSKDSDHYAPGARMKNGVDSNASQSSAAQTGPPPASVYSSTAGGLQLGVGMKSSTAGQGTNVAVSSGSMPRIQHIASSSVQSPISPSTAELNMKIASVKKVILNCNVPFCLQVT